MAQHIQHTILNILNIRVPFNRLLVYGQTSVTISLRLKDNNQ